MALFDPAQPSGVFHFGIDETGKAYLLETARWTKFLAVVGFVLMGILLLAGIFSISLFGALGASYGAGAAMGGIMMAVYIGMAALYFFPTYFLFRFSVLIKPAILHANNEQFNRALRYLKNAFRFIGIIMLVVLVLYAIIALVFVAGRAFL